MVPRVIWPELDLNLSRLAFGCAPVMGRVSRKESLNAMALAYDLGVTHFDVARSYGFGDAEGVLGQFIADKRDKVTVATKFGILPLHIGGIKRLMRPLVRSARRRIPWLASVVKKHASRSLIKGFYDLDSVKRSIETSLSELRTDAIDIVFAHDCDGDDSIGDSLTALLETLRRAGKIRAWGLATGAPEIERIARDLSRPPRVIQIPKVGSRALERFPARRIIHSSLSMAGDFCDGRGRLQPVVAAWAKQRGLDEHRFFEVLPRLLFRSALRDEPEAVILCSMYSPSHIRSNVEAFRADDRLDGMIAGFRQMTARLLDATPDGFSTTAGLA